MRNIITYGHVTRYEICQTVCQLDATGTLNWMNCEALEVIRFIAVQTNGDFSIAGGLHFAEINCSWDGTKTSMDCI